MSNNRFNAFLKEFKLKDGDTYAIQDGVCIIQIEDKVLILAIHRDDSLVLNARECLLDFSSFMDRELAVLKSATFDLDQIKEVNEFLYVICHFKGIKTGFLTTIVSGVMRQFITRVDFYRNLPQLRKRIVEME